MALNVSYLKAMKRAVLSLNEELNFLFINLFYMYYSTESKSCTCIPLFLNFYIYFILLYIYITCARNGKFSEFN